MQLAKAKIQLSGNRDNEVLKQGLTPAEVMVLQHLHGSHAVTDVVVTGTDPERNAVGEKQRIAERYNRPNKDVAKELFPGAVPNMPKTFEEANIPFELAPAAPQPKGNIVTMKGDKPDLVTEEEKKNIEEDESKVVNTTDELAKKNLPGNDTGAKTAVDEEIETDNSVETDAE